MTETVGDYILERLSDWGVKRVYGYPGDGINGLMGAMGRAADRFDYVRVRHEEMAAFMACAHAKFTGEVGVCMATSGPGAIHLLNGLYDARMDHMPVLAIVGQQARSVIGSDYQQEVDLHVLFKDVAAYVETLVSPLQVRHVIDRAMRIAAAERTVTCIVVPNDLQAAKAVPMPKRAHGTVVSGVGFASARPIPSDTELCRAADLLNAGEKVAILIGAGAMHAGSQVEQVAERLGAGVAKALLGKAALPDDLPYVTGSIGLLGTEASWKLMNDCDTLLMIGSTFPYSEFLPEEGKARAVQIDLSPRNVSIRYDIDVNLIGDAAEVLDLLLPRLKHKENPDWRERVALNVRKTLRALKAQAMEPATPINPQRVFSELSPLLPERSIICGDSGSHTNWYARDMQLRRGMLASLSGKLASMGSAVPYAIAAKMAHPDRPVLAIAGDGAMQMNGNSELITVKQYWERWSNPCFVVMVLVNNDLNEVTWEQRALSGDPRFEPAQRVEEFSYADYAKLLGFEGIRIDKPDDIAAGWRRAFESQRPVLIEFHTDPSVPPLPPHISWEQAKAYMTALAKGEPGEQHLIRETLREILAGMFPGHHRDKDA